MLRGESEVEVLVGDVHRDLGYANRYPLICSALGSLTFEQHYGVKRVAVAGPVNGARTLFRFRLSH